MASGNPGSSNRIAGAITFPARDSSSNVQPAAVQPRQPRTLQGLLRFAMEATKAEDASDNSQVGPMDEERRRYLAEALSAHTICVTDVLKKNIKILSNMERICAIKAEDEVPQDIKLAFNELAEFIDDVDIANDFDKLGGFMMFTMCLSSENVELNKLSNVTLARVCQNNINCQERALNCSLLQVLLHRLRDQKQPDQSLRALSSMVRNFEAGMNTFIAQGGCEVLASTLGKPDHPELGSAVFFINHLCRNSKEARLIFIKKDIIKTIARILKANRSDASEYLLNIIVTLVELEPAEAVPICRDPALGLKKILENHLKHEDVNNGRFIEEKESCENIIRIVFEDNNACEKKEKPDVEEADR